MCSKLHSQILETYNVNPESTAFLQLNLVLVKFKLSSFVMNRMSPVIPLFQWFSLTFIYTSSENLF